MLTISDLKEKQILRDKFLKMRLSMSIEEVKNKSRKVVENLISIDFFKKAENILLYYPFKNEVDILCLLSMFTYKKFYFPVIDFENKKLKAKEYSGSFYENKYGIKEPAGELETFEINSLDFLVIPGIVFDKEGYRIGYGGGYYDKVLKSFSKITCGVCFDEQIVEKLPCSEEHDAKVSYIVSDKRIINLIRKEK
ncbi:MAG: 5-formyltetrahydrofolate cyclo-ligase [Endomicrobia bacterium]|nr:5-formyltetrahydrofolate cyclo-ligase [Endomicrobiia bacterium]